MAARRLTRHVTSVPNSNFDLANIRKGRDGGHAKALELHLLKVVSHTMLNESNSDAQLITQGKRNKLPHHCLVDKREILEVAIYLRE